MKITIHLRNAPDTIAIVKIGENWKNAAARAIRRAHGRRAVAYNWVCDEWAQDQSGRVIASFYRATVIGAREQHGAGYPVLDEARVTVSSHA